MRHSAPPSPKSAPRFTVTNRSWWKASPGAARPRSISTSSPASPPPAHRRGYAPTPLCHDCGWVARCQRCDAHLIYHQSQRRLRCHHCSSEQKAEPHCPACSSDELRALGHGTERVEQVLREHFPDHAIARIDRDSTRRKGSLQQLLDAAQRGEYPLLIGTQMLAKGHHLPKVTLAAILDADQGLFSVDFRASETLAQLIIQVAGRAGRAEHAGEVLIQTHHPEHPLLRTLLAEQLDT